MTRLLALLDHLLNAIAMLLVVVLLAVVTAGIVSRALNHPLSWTDELGGFVMVWLACFGWMLAARRHAHIRIRFFQDKLPPDARRWTESMIQIGVAALGAVVAFKSIYLVQVNSDVLAISLPLSTAWMYVPLFPAGLVTLAIALADLLVTVRGQTPSNGNLAP
jgi:TRAP-type transport system small permease protein